MTTTRGGGNQMVSALEKSIHIGRRHEYKILNGRHRKKLIHSLIQDEGTIEGDEQLKSYIRKYYKVYSDILRKVTSLWMRVIRMIYPRFLMRKTTY
jgi:hypothetical protein